MWGGEVPLTVDGCYGNISAVFHILTLLSISMYLHEVYEQEEGEEEEELFPIQGLRPESSNFGDRC